MLFVYRSVNVWSFQFHLFDEYVFNAVAFSQHLMKYRRNVANTTSTDHTSNAAFQSLHGMAKIDDKRNVIMFFSVWDLDPTNALFYPALEQIDPPHGPLVVVRNRVINWPGNGQAPPSDYCAFYDCSTGTAY